MLLLPPSPLSSPQEQGQLPQLQVGLPYPAYGAALSRAASHQSPRNSHPQPGRLQVCPWQGMGRAGVSVPGHSTAWLSSGSMPQGLALPAHLGHTPKVVLTPAEDARDASEASWEKS